MQADPTTTEARAIDWLIRQRDPGFADWDGFADWLAEDVSHAEIYDMIAGFDHDLDALPKTGAPAAPVIRPVEVRRPSRRAWFGGAIAAALVGVVSLTSFGLFGDDANRIETAAGEYRTVTLADGSRIEINGASVIELDKDRPRFARLASGEAMFHVVHRDGDPFVVETGGSKIVDLGTAFNVVRRNRATSVAVSEGIVVYNPGKDDVRMTAGKAIDVRDDDKAPPAVRDVDAGSVGGWRTGLLVYNGAPLSVVAEDLQRTAGLKISVAPEAADVSFRGALVVDKNRARTVADLAALSGTTAQRQGDGWVLKR